MTLNMLVRRRDFGFTVPTAQGEALEYAKDISSKDPIDVRAFCSRKQSRKCQAPFHLVQALRPRVSL